METLGRSYRFKQIQNLQDHNKADALYLSSVAARLKAQQKPTQSPFASVQLVIQRVEQPNEGHTYFAVPNPEIPSSPYIHRVQGEESIAVARADFE